jgi:hypothetical protein
MVVQVSLRTNYHGMGILQEHPKFRESYGSLGLDLNPLSCGTDHPYVYLIVVFLFNIIEQWQWRWKGWWQR